MAQTENTLRHTNRIRGMVVGEGGRSTGVLLNYMFHTSLIFCVIYCILNVNVADFII